MWRRLGIEPTERKLFFWAAATLFLIGWADVSVKNASETLFLKRVGVFFLPMVFLAGSLLLVGTTDVAGRLASRFDRLRLLPAALLVLALLLLPLWVLVRSNIDGVYVVLVIASKQIPSVALLVFWVAMGDLLHGRQAKRLFAPLMAGVTLGTILGSFASEPIGRVLGIDGLLTSSALALALAAWVSTRLRSAAPLRLHSPGTFATTRREQSTVTFLGLWRDNALFRILLLVGLASGLLGPILYFQFSYVADLATAGADGEERLLALYAQVRGWLSIAILIAQLVATSRLFQVIGMPLALGISPIVYAIGFFGLSINLSLRVGVGALVGTKIQDNAVYDPAMRILFNLFPERIRSRATTLLEGPVKRSGGVLGNLVVLLALAVSTPVVVGYVGLSISIVWLVIAIWLWRAYPTLLLKAASNAGRHGKANLEFDQLLDPATLRSLTNELASDDIDRSQAAIALVCEASTAGAITALASASLRAPANHRPHLIDAMDAILERRVDDVIDNAAAEKALCALVEERDGLRPIDRANAVQAVGRIARNRRPRDAARLVLDRTAEDPEPAVRLAAIAARCRRGLAPPEGQSLDASLLAAVNSDDLALRQIAREELRFALLESTIDETWNTRLVLLTSMLRDEPDRAHVASAIAEVAGRHGPATRVAADAMLALRDCGDLAVLCSVMRFAGRADLPSEVDWLIDGLSHRDRDVSASAALGLRALGVGVADRLLQELAFGKRRIRDPILEIIRDLDVDEKALESLYERELETIPRLAAHSRSLMGVRNSGILMERLQERIEESGHTALLMLAALRRDGRMAELSDHLKRTRSRRQRAILLEALEALLDPRDQARVIPVLEDPAGASASQAEVAAEDVLEELRQDPDELTRLIVAELIRTADVGPLAGNDTMSDDGSVLSPVEIAIHLKTLPLFEPLTTRQLVDLAKVAREVGHPAGVEICREGDFDDTIFLIVDGQVTIQRSGAVLTELGPRDFFGEMAVFDGSPRSADAVTKTRVRLLCLKRDDLFRLMEDLPAIGISICQTLSRRVRDLNQQLSARESSR